jgi:hypothetical protein
VTVLPTGPRAPWRSWPPRATRRTRSRSRPRCAPGPRTAVFGLARRRESLARIKADPRAALTVLAAGDVAFTAHGRAAVLDEVAEGVVAVRLDVDRVQEHGQPTFVIDDGVVWHWTDKGAEERNGAVIAALAATLPSA